jgi:hypothetical protein
MSKLSLFLLGTTGFVILGFPVLGMEGKTDRPKGGFNKKAPLPVTPGRQVDTTPSGAPKALPSRVLPSAPRQQINQAPPQIPDISSRTRGASMGGPSRNPAAPFVPNQQTNLPLSPAPDLSGRPRGASMSGQPGNSAASSTPGRQIKKSLPDIPAFPGRSGGAPVSGQPGNSAQPTVPSRSTKTLPGLPTVQSPSRGGARGTAMSPPPSVSTAGASCSGDKKPLSKLQERQRKFAEDRRKVDREIKRGWTLEKEEAQNSENKIPGSIQSAFSIENPIPSDKIQELIAAHKELNIYQNKLSTNKMEIGQQNEISENASKKIIELRRRQEELNEAKKKTKKKKSFINEEELNKIPGAIEDQKKIIEQTKIKIEELTGNRASISSAKPSPVVLWESKEMKMRVEARIKNNSLDPIIKAITSYYCEKFLAYKPQDVIYQTPDKENPKNEEDIKALRTKILQKLYEVFEKNAPSPSVFHELTAVYKPRTEQPYAGTTAGEVNNESERGRKGKLAEFALHIKSEGQEMTLEYPVRGPSWDDGQIKLIPALLYMSITTIDLK